MINKVVYITENKEVQTWLWGAGGRVVKPLGSIAGGPGFESRWRRKCWAVVELFVNIYRGFLCSWSVVWNRPKTCLTLIRIIVHLPLVRIWATQVSRLTGSVTYSASASPDEVSTSGEPRGRSWCRNSVLCARYSFVVWIIAVACRNACANCQ